MRTPHGQHTEHCKSADCVTYVQVDSRPSAGMGSAQFATGGSEPAPLHGGTPSDTGSYVLVSPGGSTAGAPSRAGSSQLNDLPFSTPCHASSCSDDTGGRPSTRMSSPRSPPGALRTAAPPGGAIRPHEAAEETEFFFASESDVDADDAETADQGIETTERRSCGVDSAAGGADRGAEGTARQEMLVHVDVVVGCKLKASGHCMDGVRIWQRWPHIRKCVRYVVTYYMHVT